MFKIYERFITIYHFTYHSPHKSPAMLVFLILVFTFFAVACQQNESPVTPQQRKTAENRAKVLTNIDELAHLQKQLESKGDYIGSIAVLRQWGKILREECRFKESVMVYQKALKQARRLNDTLEVVQILNGIGTNYRRLSMLDVAQEYHYRALKISEESNDTTTITKKNLVVSLNGLGNIYMNLGFYERADSAFRRALKGEHKLHSLQGLAINYANIGSIFEKRNLNDSAWVYYTLSMTYNRKARNDMGISLCHTYFGQLYEKKRQYDKAAAEYEKAYELMKASKDDWHALTPLCALIKVRIITGDMEQAKVYLAKAAAMADKIKSFEQQAEVNSLYTLFYQKKGDYQKAFDCYTRSEALKDSMVDMNKVYQMEKDRLSIERDRQAQKISIAEKRASDERRAKLISYALLALVFIAFVMILTQILYILRIRIRTNKQLTKMSNLRETFFTNVTHEFRTPLTVILGLSHQLANDGKLPDYMHDKMWTIHRQGQSLLTLINQLLDITKVKSAVGDPDWRSGDIVSYIGMVIESYRDYADSRKIKLVYTAPKNCVIDFVPDYVNKVFNNLISNALKFTPENGTITVDLSHSGHFLYFNVSDTGTGIDEETLENIFVPFYQGKTESKARGSGIGLALVKQIIDSINGDIKVESTIGIGTTFKVRIPIRYGGRSFDRIPPEERENLPLLPIMGKPVHLSKDIKENKQQILLMEDDNDLANYIGNFLESKYAVFHAHNGREGLQKAQEMVPDIIITDLMMPEMDGLEVCEQLKANELTDHIPIIIMTARINDKDRFRGLQAGADAYLNKPFDSEELIMRVEKLLEQRERLRKKFSKTLKEAKIKTDNNAMKENGLRPIDRSFLLKVTEKIHFHLSKNQDIDINLLASDMCLSYIQFYRKMVAVTGMTPVNYLLRIKIQKAQQLLDNNPTMSFKDVAELSGFSDYSNFLRSFKKICDVTPSQYIKNKE